MKKVFLLTAVLALGLTVAFAQTSSGAGAANTTSSNQQGTNTNSTNPNQQGNTTGTSTDTNTSGQQGVPPDTSATGNMSTQSSNQSGASQSPSSTTGGAAGTSSSTSSGTSSGSDMNQQNQTGNSGSAYRSNQSSTGMGSQTGTSSDQNTNPQTGTCPTGAGRRCRRVRDDLPPDRAGPLRAGCLRASSPLAGALGRPPQRHLDRADARYYGDGVHLSDGYRLGWSYIPHLVSTRFYTYAYVFAKLVALALYARWRAQGEEFVAPYLKFVAAGGSGAPADLLAVLGVDLSGREIWTRTRTGCRGG